jgi:hypothetical protein
VLPPRYVPPAGARIAGATGEVRGRSASPAPPGPRRGGRPAAAAAGRTRPHSAACRAALGRLPAAPGRPLPV